MPYNFLGFTPSHEFREPRPKSKFGFHGGQDLSAREGTPVPAQFAGTVFRSGPIHGYGRAVIVESKAPNGKLFIPFMAI
jgi:murein DD-endopeptidase MepM/ murein hydrolase activator NlpD